MNLLENPLLPPLIVFLITYFLIGTIRREQYVKFGVYYTIKGTSAVKLGLVTITTLLFLGLDFLLHLSKSNTNLNTYDPNIDLILPSILGGIFYIILYFLGKKVKQGRPDPQILFRLYLFPILLFVLALLVFIKQF